MGSGWTKTLSSALKFHYSSATRWKGVLLLFAASLLLIASSSELWFSNDQSFFNRIPSYPISLVVPFLLSCFLCILYFINWRSIHREKWVRVAPLYAIICTKIDIIIMFLLVIIAYSSIGEIGYLNANTLCKLLYLAIPLAIGEFTLSSILSSELRKARELEKRLKKSNERLDDNIKEWKEFEDESLIPERPTDKKITEYLEKKRGEGENRDGQRKGDNKSRGDSEVT